MDLELKRKKIINSVYLSAYLKDKREILKKIENNSIVFTSLHILEEFNSNYNENICELLRELKIKKCYVVADISRKTIDILKIDNLLEFCKKNGISNLRFDIGFSTKEISSYINLIDTSINISTLSELELKKIIEKWNKKYHVWGFHNYYPKPNSGLSRNFFNKKNILAKKYGILIAAFVPGDLKFRGPIFEGLPTIEDHRTKSTYFCIVDYFSNQNIDYIVIGDYKYNNKDLIKSLFEKQLISIPLTNINKKWVKLLNKQFTVREDFSRDLIRIKESRNYASLSTEKNVLPENCLFRSRGCLTIDNKNYKRYNGEICITKNNLDKDLRVNVIGKIHSDYLNLIPLVEKIGKMIFVLIE